MPRHRRAHGSAEGAAVELLVLDADDGLDDEERQALRASIDRGLEQADRGEVIEAAEVVRGLRSV
jgi:predicted transcriptional regulator